MLSGDQEWTIRINGEKCIYSQLLGGEEVGLEYGLHKGGARIEERSSGL